MPPRKVKPTVALDGDVFYNTVCAAISDNKHWGGDIGLHQEDMAKLHYLLASGRYRRHQQVGVLFSPFDSTETGRVFVWETDRVKPGILLILGPQKKGPRGDVQFDRAKKRVKLFGGAPKKAKKVKLPPPSRFERDEIL